MFLLFAKELVGDAVPVIVGSLALFTFTPLGDSVISKIGGVPPASPPRSRPSRPFVSASSARPPPAAPPRAPSPPPPPPRHPLTRSRSCTPNNPQASLRQSISSVGRASMQPGDSQPPFDSRQAARQRRPAEMPTIRAQPLSPASASTTATTATSPRTVRAQQTAPAQSTAPRHAPDAYPRSPRPQLPAEGALIALPIVATGAVAAVSAAPLAMQWITPHVGATPRRRRSSDGMIRREGNMHESSPVYSPGQGPAGEREGGSRAVGGGAYAVLGKPSAQPQRLQRADRNVEAGGAAATAAASSTMPRSLAADGGTSVEGPAVKAGPREPGGGPGGDPLADARSRETSPRPAGAANTRMDAGAGDAEVMAGRAAAGMGEARGSAAAEEGRDAAYAGWSRRRPEPTDPGQSEQRSQAGSERIGGWREVEEVWREWGAGSGAAARRRAVVQGWAAGVRDVGSELSDRVAAVPGREAAASAVSAAAGAAAGAAKAAAEAAQAGAREGMRDVVTGASAAQQGAEGEPPSPAAASRGGAAAGGEDFGTAPGSGSAMAGEGGSAARADADPRATDARMHEPHAGEESGNSRQEPEVVSEVEVLLPQQYETLQRQKRLQRRREVQEQRRQAAERASGGGEPAAWRSMWGAAETAGRWASGERRRQRSYRRSDDARGWGEGAPAGGAAQEAPRPSPRTRRRAPDPTGQGSAAVEQGPGGVWQQAPSGGGADVPAQPQRARRMTARDMAQARARGEGVATADFVGLRRREEHGLLGGLMRWVLGHRARQRVRDRVRAARRPVLTTLLKLFPFLRSWGGFM